MIFVTVGTQEPFDRLIETVDVWSAEQGRQDVIAQVGRSTYVPRSIKVVASLTPKEFGEHLEQASTIVSHAGMGTILQVASRGKPLVVMPRLASQGEHRNDHQSATVKALEPLGAFHAAYDVEGLRRLLDRIEELPECRPIQPTASEPLLDRLRGFLVSSLGRPASASPAPPRNTDPEPVKSASGRIR